MEFVCDDNPHPCIPDGIYDAVCFKNDKAYYYGSLKLFLHFKIIAPAEYKGTKIFLPFNMPNNGRLSQGSKYYKTWVMVNGWMKPSRNTEMKPRIFMKKVFKIKTCKVNPCHNGKEMPANHQYSKVKEIVEVVTGAKT
jgi:hypothetical protein